MSLFNFSHSNQTTRKYQIISQFSILRWVVTAAHCLIHKDDIFVYNGQFSKDAFDRSERVKPCNQHIHPSFVDDKTFRYDIGPYKWIYLE